jgi:hypothetical protein
MVKVCADETVAAIVQKKQMAKELFQLFSLVIHNPSLCSIEGPGALETGTTATHIWLRRGKVQRIKCEELSFTTKKWSSTDAPIRQIPSLRIE